MGEKDIKQIEDMLKSAEEYLKPLAGETPIWIIEFQKNINKNYITIKKLYNAYKQDEKVINEMAEYLADCDFDECCAEKPHICIGCSWEDYEPHTNCIKEYFRKKGE